VLLHFAIELFDDGARLDRGIAACGGGERAVDQYAEREGMLMLV
jgi:hypothetical protein